MIAPIAHATRVWKETPGTVRGILLVLIGTFTASGSGAMIRYTAQEIHAFEVVFFRALFALILLVPSLSRAGLSSLKTKRFPLHALRGGVQSCSMMLGFLGFALTPLAKATSLQFTAPLFATLLAVVILGEVIRVRRVAALSVGFAGALIVLQPWQGSYDVGALASLGSAFFFSMVMIFVRMLGTTDTPTTQLTYLAMFSIPITLAFAIPVWETPTLIQLGMMAVIGVLTTTNHLLLAHALRLAELTAVMPIQFTKLIWAAAIGYAIFGEIPDLWTWLGGSLIFGSVIYVTIRERQVQKRRQAAAQASDGTKD